MSTLELYLGQSLALLTAVTWAFAVILFRRSGESVHPIGLNLFKDLLAIVLLLPTIWLFEGELFRRVALSDYGLLLISGALGIGVADTLFFMSLNALVPAFPPSLTASIARSSSAFRYCGWGSR